MPGSIPRPAWPADLLQGAIFREPGVYWTDLRPAFIFICPPDGGLAGVLLGRQRKLETQPSRRVLGEGGSGRAGRWLYRAHSPVLGPGPYVATEHHRQARPLTRPLHGSRHDPRGLSLSYRQEGEAQGGRRTGKDRTGSEPQRPVCPARALGRSADKSRARHQVPGSDGRTGPTRRG